ncbi:head-tail adaptor protein [Zhenhengia yiwuensis]|uniref:phage head completion protein n=1 Tax=Zhenhengia yiwuensis TaxID=2763666 RepID=UPI003AB91A83
MRFDAGKLNKGITFIAYTETTNSIGQTILQEHMVKQMWANIMPIQGFEQTLEERLGHEIGTQGVASARRNIGCN